MDRVVQTEFKKEFPFKVTEAVASTLTKALVQYQVQKETGAMGSLLSAVYQAATTHADTRSWSALPKEVQVARIKQPESKQLKINAPGLEQPLDIQLPDNRFTIVHVKATSANSIPVYQVIGFDA